MEIVPVNDGCNTSWEPESDQRGRNVVKLLARREISPRTRNFAKFWGNASNQKYLKEASVNARSGLISWEEGKSLVNLKANCSPLLPPLKSSIAVAFSSDGKMLACSHDDYKVKIIDCQSGMCLSELERHTRTPWVVRFHPSNPEVVASGSLDQHVLLWNPQTSTIYIGFKFPRAIASISFHAVGDVLAVASGRKVYIWLSNMEILHPVKVLKTENAYRAVIFHPRGDHLLTAEVFAYSTELPMTRATSWSQSIGSQTGPSPVRTDLVQLSLDARGGKRFPSTVNIKIWAYDIEKPCEPLADCKCLLTIPYAVLFSERGAHFSPCGRFLALCVACILPAREFVLLTGAGSSLGRDSRSSPQLMFELRIYSFEKSNFGTVVVSRPVRHAYCLTSIQFSPSSEYILLSYGERDAFHVCSVVDEVASSVYSVVEVYRVSDMQLVTVLPSLEDDVNVALFYPTGGGLVYGTKEGNLKFWK